MFDFVVRRLGVLKHIPIFPHVFDTLLKITTLFSNRRVLDYVDEIENEVLLWRGTSVRVHKFGGIEFNLNDKEIGHIHGNGFLDILFSRQIKSNLLEHGKALEHHTFKASGWVTLPIRTEEDKIIALELLRSSYQLHI